MSFNIPLRENFELLWNGTHFFFQLSKKLTCERTIFFLWVKWKIYLCESKLTRFDCCIQRFVLCNKYKKKLFGLISSILICYVHHKTGNKSYTTTVHTDIIKCPRTDIRNNMPFILEHLSFVKPKHQISCNKPNVSKF